MKNYIKTIISIIAFLALNTIDVNGKGSSFSSSGGSKSSGSSFTSSGGTGKSTFSNSNVSKSAPPASSNANTNKSSNFTSSSATKPVTTGNTVTKESVSSKNQSSTDKALNNKVAMTSSGKTREQVAADFRKTNADKYNTKFASEPSARPSYIPQVHIINGYSSPIYYDSYYHGYGFINSFGMFVLYDALSRQSEIHASNYNYGNQPVVVYHRSHGVFYYLINTFLFIIVIGGIVLLILAMNRKNNV